MTDFIPISEIINTNVSWSYKGYYNGHYLLPSNTWRDFKQLNNNALEYAYNKNITFLTTNKGVLIFDLNLMTMELNPNDINDSITIPIIIPIKRSL